MKQSGFTLIELLAVIVVISIISIVALPPIINQMTKSKEKFSDTTKKVLYAAGDIYLDAHQNQYNKKNGNQFCVSLQELVDSGNLDAPIIDANSGQEISLSKVLKYKVDNRGIIMNNLELLDPSGCTPINK